MGWRLLFIALLAISTPAALAGQHRPTTENGDEIAARHLARLRAVFREAQAPEVLFSAIVYSSGHPEHAVGLRRSGDAYEVFGLYSPHTIWDYAQVDMLRSGTVRVMTLRRGGRFDDRSEEEADLIAATLPPDPLDVQLSRCSIALGAELANSLGARWQGLFLQLRPVEPSGSPGFIGTYLTRTGNEEREFYNSQWVDEDMVELVDGLYSLCRSDERDRDSLLSRLEDLIRGERR